MIHLKDLPKILGLKKEILLKLAQPIILNNLVEPVRFNSIYKDVSNIVLSQANIPLPYALLKDVGDEIKKTFRLDVSFGLLIFKPQRIPSFFPPHNDGGRNLALNYILKTGGNSVVTKFYKAPYDYTKNDRHYWHEESLELNDEYTVLENEWYAFDAQLPHAVFNIQETRIILMCFLEGFDSNISFLDFKNNYLLS